MKHLNIAQKTSSSLLKYLFILLLSCCLLVGCDVNLSGSGGPSTCLGNCTVGTGAHGLAMFVEPDDGPEPIVNAIRNAKKSVWLEIYLLSNQDIISALEE